MLILFVFKPKFVLSFSTTTTLFQSLVNLWAGTERQKDRKTARQKDRKTEKTKRQMGGDTSFQYNLPLNEELRKKKN